MQRTTIGLDIAKRVFQVHAVDPASGEVTRTKLQRSELLQYFAQQPPALIAMEACGSAQHWAREFRKLGHEPPAAAAEPQCSGGGPGEQNGAADLGDPRPRSDL